MLSYFNEVPVGRKHLMVNQVQLAKISRLQAHLTGNWWSGKRAGQNDHICSPFHIFRCQMRKSTRYLLKYWRQSTFLCSWEYGSGSINPESMTSKLFSFLPLCSGCSQSHFVPFLAKEWRGKQSSTRGPVVISQLNYIKHIVTMTLLNWNLIAKVLLKCEIGEIF